MENKEFLETTIEIENLEVDIDILYVSLCLLESKVFCFDLSKGVFSGSNLDEIREIENAIEEKNKELSKLREKIQLL